MVNHTLFDKWNETSAYILGFWLADGNIALDRKRPTDKHYFKKFSICNTDRQTIYMIGKILGLTPRKRKRQKPHYKLQYVIQIISDQLFDFCYAITKATNKSHNVLHIPNIPRNVFHHFVRGFFDGDGSIFYKHYRNRHGNLAQELGTSFTAGCDTGNFLTELKNGIRHFITVGDKQICKSKGIYKGNFANGKGNLKLSFGQYDSALLCEWMYRDATLYMRRKKRIWDSADKERLLNSKKFFSNKV